MKNPYLLPIVIVLSTLFLNGCMTMGWGGNRNDRSATTGRSRLLIKERQVEDYMLVAYFPPAVTGREVRFILEIKDQVPRRKYHFESISLHIDKRNGNTAETPVAEVQPHSSLSSSTRFVFPYRFDEAGNYRVTFTLKDSSGKVTEDSYAVSAPLSVPADYKSNHHSFINSAPWILVGSAVMVGMMVWMMIY